ncbi:MAG: DUF91 domain-containing protein [Leptolyngbya sp. PLA1]|nr:DUF91 domain-containing protein [Leptolyngbya sp. PLA1]
MSRRHGLLSRLAARLARWWMRFRTREPDTRRLGRLGEQAAAEYLVSLGYRVVERNVFVPMGEADLVCESPEGVMVVVEVKTRVRGRSPRSDAIAPEAAITARKSRKLRAIARHLAKANGWTGVRIDSVGVEVPSDGPPVVRHTPGIGALGR